MKVVVVKPSHQSSHNILCGVVIQMHMLCVNICNVFYDFFLRRLSPIFFTTILFIPPMCLMHMQGEDVIVKTRGYIEAVKDGPEALEKYFEEHFPVACEIGSHYDKEVFCQPVPKDGVGFDYAEMWAGGTDVAVLVPRRIRVSTLTPDDVEVDTDVRFSVPLEFYTHDLEDVNESCEEEEGGVVCRANVKVDNPKRFCEIVEAAPHDLPGFPKEDVKDVSCEAVDGDRALVKVKFAGDLKDRARESFGSILGAAAAERYSLLSATEDDVEEGLEEYFRDKVLPDNKDDIWVVIPTVGGDVEYDCYDNGVCYAEFRLPLEIYYRASKPENVPIFLDKFLKEFEVR